MDESRMKMLADMLLAAELSRKPIAPLTESDAAVPVAAGDFIRADFGHLGDVKIRFA